MSGQGHFFYAGRNGCHSGNSCEQKHRCGNGYLRTPTLRTILLLLPLLLLPACATDDTHDTSLIIGVASSLAAPIEEIIDSFHVAYPDLDYDIRISAAGSDVLVRQSQLDNPYNILILASNSMMDRLIPDPGILERFDLASNRLCLVLPQSSRLAPPRDLTDLLDNRFERIGIGSRSVPIGEYGHQVLERSGLYERLEDRLIEARDAATLLRYVEMNEVDAALIYRSDAGELKNLRVIRTIDSTLHDPILYPVAVPGGIESRRSKSATIVMEFLRGEVAARVLEGYGLVD